MPTSLSFDSVRYTVKTSATGKPAGPLDKFKGATVDKDLLKDISGSVTSGHVLAILGPSGAGKTTLLNMLTLEKKGGVPVGRIKVNGKPFTISKYNEIAAYVEQFDTLWASLTVREHLKYAMELYQPGLSAAEREDAIAKLVKDVGLEDQMDVKAGDVFQRGLSGGNKRRLSIAVALAKKPSVLFLDEPTSGVDSASAVMIMGFLKEIARSAQIAIVCTIHQPPASVFAGFDNAMILSMGRIAYFGKATAMGEYFASIGKPPPADTNLAEFVLDLVNKDFTSAESVLSILDRWAERGNQPYGVDGAEPDGVEEPPPKRAGICAQFGVLTRRSVVVASREPLAYLVRIVAHVFCCTFFGIIYLETRNRRQDQVQSRTFFVLFGVGIPLQMVLVSVYLYYTQWISLRKEVKDGMYHPVAGALASWVIQVPMMFLLAAAAMIPLFIIGDLHWPNFPMAWLMYTLMLWAFEGLAQMLAVAPNVVLGLFNYLGMYFTAFLFCGMFVDTADVIWPLRAFCYFFPMSWGLQSFVHAIYHGGPDYEGAMNCTAGELLPNGALCSYQGFYCSSDDDPTGAVCYGISGDQILNSLSVQFPIYGDDGHYPRNIAFVIAFGLLMRVNYAGLVFTLTKVLGGEEPKEPSGGASTTADTVKVDVKSPKVEAEESAKFDGFAEATSLAKGSRGVFAFTDIGYTIAPGMLKKGEPKEVLARCSAAVCDDEVLAIVGPSGAGKTILLDTLTFTKGPGAPHGKITLNGTALSRDLAVASCIYVPRDDNLWPPLTPREHLDLAYKLFRPDLAGGARTKAIDDLLAATGMTSAQHTKAGGLLFQGLSGGQRRRLSLAIALVKQPRVIILDEPTSGLDSAAAAAIIALLKSIAKKCGAAIVCTIHQPSAAVFAGFDKVLVLAEGRVAYCGARDGMAPHFASIGKPLSKDANPAEAVLDLVSKDITSPDEVKAVLDGWEAAKDKAAAALAAPEAGPLKLDTKRAGLCAETWHVLKRQMKLALTDPLQYIARMFICPFVCSFFGLVYVESRDDVQYQVPFRLFYLWWILCVPPCLAIIAVIGMNFDMRTAVAEMKAGMYRPISYAFSTGLVQLPMLFFLSLVTNVFCFAIGGWPWDNFITFVALYACNLLVFESLAQLLAILFKNPIVGMLGFLGYWSSSIMFCGLVFRGKDVIWPFRTMYYALPLRWLFNGCGYDIYMPTTFTDATSCVAGATINTTQGEALCPPTGFYCETSGTSSLGCYGYTGSEVLSTLHFMYESLDNTDDRLMDLGILLGMAALIKAQYTFFLWRAVEESDAPKETATATRSQIA